MIYKGGRYDFLLNSDRNIDLLSKRFIVFEIDAVKDNKDLFPVVTIIIMETFIFGVASLIQPVTVLLLTRADSDFATSARLWLTGTLNA